MRKLKIFLETHNLWNNWYTKLFTYKSIQINETKEAINSIENGKSPGVDGVPIEFYKEFFEIIKYDLQTPFNNTLFQSQGSPKTWNQAIITLIPKKGI